jgi:tetratricopeptide (TPR) repeat protein
VVYARARAFADQDLEILAYLGRETEALNYARLRTEPKERFDGLTIIYQAMCVQGRHNVALLDEIEQTTDTVRHEIARISALNTLAILLIQATEKKRADSTLENMVTTVLSSIPHSFQWSGEDHLRIVNDVIATLIRAGRPDAAETIVYAIPLVPRQSVLSGIVPMFAQEGMLKKAEIIAHEIKDRGKQAEAMSALVTVLAQMGQLDQAETIARSIEDEEHLAAALRALALALALTEDTRADTVFDEVERILHNIRGGWARSSALRDLAAALAQARRFDRAEKVAHSIREDEHRASALCAVAVALAKNKVVQAETVFDEAESAICDIQGSRIQDWALRTLVSALTQVENFDRAEAVARRIPGNDIQASSLRNLASALAQAGKLQQATTVYYEALSVSNSIHDAERIAATLHSVVIALAQEGHFTKAEKVTQCIQANLEREQALCELAIALAQAGQFPEANDMAHSIIYAGTRARALCALASSLARAEDVQASTVFEETLATVRSIPYDGDRAVELRNVTVALFEARDMRFGSVFREARQACNSDDEDFRVETLRDLAVDLAQAGLFEEAGSVINSISMPGALTTALCALAVAMTKAGNAQADEAFTAASTVAFNIRYPDIREAALHNLAVSLAQAGYCQKAETISHDIQDTRLLTSALRSLAIALAHIGDTRTEIVFDEALASARSIPYITFKISALHELAVALLQVGDTRGKSTLDEALAVVHNIWDENSRTIELRVLATTLVKLKRYSEAFAVLQTLELDELVEVLAKWSLIFEEVALGLAEKVLCETIRIIGWIRPDWREIHELLTADEQGTDV